MRRELMIVTIITLILLISVPGFCKSKLYVAIYAGSAQLNNSECRISLDDLPDDYYVVITPKVPCGPLYISDKESDGFWVKEAQIGRSNGSEIEFDYLVFGAVSPQKRTSRLAQPPGELIELKASSPSPNENVSEKKSEPRINLPLVETKTEDDARPLSGEVK